VRFVPTSVMTGFLTAVGVNIVLGQLSNFTGYQARGANRVLRSLDTVVNVVHWSVPAVTAGAITVLVILVFLPTRFASLGLVVAVVVGSGSAALLNLWVGDPVVLLRDLVAVPAGLPAPVLPMWSDILVLLVPAISLALVCIVQGAGVSAGLPTPGGRRADPSRDVIGQGVGNLVSGLFQGMPVGGSMSASSLLVQAGARTRLSVFVSAAVMAVVILFGSGLVAHTAMPALAGLLIVVGVSSIRPSKIVSVVRTGPLPTTIMAVTFALTLVIPLQFAVLVGAGLGIVLYVARQSNRVRLRQLHLSPNGRMRESDPDRVLEPGTVVVLQPYGSLFFASAPVFEGLLPEVRADSQGAVVILRLRGIDELGLATIDIIARYAARLHDADSTLKIVADDPRVLAQIEAAGLDRVIGAHNLYRGGEWVGRALRRAAADARAEAHPPT
jgi:sulfate permease, SulP family